MFIKIMSMASVLSLGVTGTAVVTAEPESTLYPIKTEIEQVISLQTDAELNATNNTNTQNQSSLNIFGGLQIGN